MSRPSGSDKCCIHDKAQHFSDGKCVYRDCACWSNGGAESKNQAELFVAVKAILGQVNFRPEFDTDHRYTGMKWTNRPKITRQLVELMQKAGAEKLSRVCGDTGPTNPHKLQPANDIEAIDEDIQPLARKLLGILCAYSDIDNLELGEDKFIGHHDVDTAIGEILEAIEELISEAVRKGKEIFIPVRGYEGLYEVSNTGKVRSISRGRNSGGVLAQGGRPEGKINYMSVTLSKNGKGKTFSVHRLVAEAFISNPENKRTVNHKDCDPTNNDVSNLEWATYSENILHAFQNGKRPWNLGKRNEICKRGHKFTEANTYKGVNGDRWDCRACDALRTRQQREELRGGSDETR